MSKPWLTVESEETPEGTNVVIRGTFMDDSEPRVELVQSDFLSLTATILDQRTREVIGLWDELDVLGDNGGSFAVPEGGTIASRFTLRIPREDLDMQTAGKELESRRVLLNWTFNTGPGVGEGYAEVTFPLRRRAVPAA